MNSRTEHDPDKSKKNPRQNSWRAYQAFKNLSEIQLNEENEDKETEIEELRKRCWEVKEKLVDDGNPFLKKEDFKEIERKINNG
ncbi:MAG: hypothetical protein ABEJ83_01130 [Candidatus Nanohaloarchaea archaeon]